MLGRAKEFNILFPYIIKGPNLIPPTILKAPADQTILRELLFTLNSLNGEGNDYGEIK